jgi:predicted dehydrogenase
MATKVGVIGAGGMVRYHIEGFKAAGAEVIAIADVNEAAARRVADAQDIPNVYGDVAVDAVTVIVPNKFHAPLAIQCLKAGKHVFCEKPPALNAGGARR